MRDSVFIGLVLVAGYKKGLCLEDIIGTGITDSVLGSEGRCC